MQEKGKGSPDFNEAHQELPGMKSLPSCEGAEREELAVWEDLIWDEGAGAPFAILAIPALQTPPWTTTEVAKARL